LVGRVAEKAGDKVVTVCLSEAVIKRWRRTPNCK
jgi:hypothetical protein